jgi:hypothetical protein
VELVTGLAIRYLGEATFPSSKKNQKTNTPAIPARRALTEQKSHHIELVHDECRDQVIYQLKIM